MITLISKTLIFTLMASLVAFELVTAFRQADYFPEPAIPAGSLIQTETYAPMSDLIFNGSNNLNKGAVYIDAGISS